MPKLDRLFRLGASVLLGIVLFALSVFLWKWFHPRNELILYGNVDIRQADLSFQVGGRISAMLLEEGDKVNPGDVIAVLDKAPYEAALAAAQGSLDQAKATYEKYVNGNRPQEIQEAYANVDEQKAILDNALRVYKRQKKQFSATTISQQDYEAAFANKLEAEARFKNMSEALSLAKEGFRKEDIEAAKAAFDNAKAQLQTSQLNLKYTDLIAPSEGVIMVRAAEVGEVVSPLSVVYTLSLYKPVWIRAYVTETDLGRLKLGMKAKVFTDAHPDKPLTGQVGFISPQAEFTPKTVEATDLRTDLVYRLRIIVDDPHHQLRQGMPVTLKIKLAQ